MRLIDADKLPITETWALVNTDNNSPAGISFAPLSCVLKKDIDAASTVEKSQGEEIEAPFITECRKEAIKKGLPLYFIYYEETGVFEAYITKTNELFEKRHCSKYLSKYEFEHLTYQYLDDYSEYLFRKETINE